MFNGSGGHGAAVVPGGALAAGPGARWLALLALLTIVAAGCDQFSTERVAETCLRSAMKAGEPFGNERERQETEAQLRHYCQLAAQGK